MCAIDILFTFCCIPTNISPLNTSIDTVRHYYRRYDVTFLFSWQYFVYLCSNDITALAVLASRPVVGSSRNKTAGDIISSIPMFVRLRSPPETPRINSVPTFINNATFSGVEAICRASNTMGEQRWKLSARKFRRQELVLFKKITALTLVVLVKTLMHCVNAKNESMTC